MSLLLALSVAEGLALTQEDGRVLEALGRTARKLAEEAGPSVVSLEVDRDPRSDAEGFNPNQGAVKDYYRRPKGPVTGTVIDADGLILTSWFNVSGTVRSMTVVLASGVRHKARLLGVDKGNDLALLAIDAKGLPVLRTARMDAVKTGQFAFVLGRSPDPARVTITDGIISATHRMKETAFQLDAEMNFGSSGGPVLDAEGRLVGIACRVTPKASWGQSGGVGFATRMDVIERVLPDLKAGKIIEKLRVPWIGINSADSTDPPGVRVVEVYSGTPAEGAKLEAGDVIVAVGDDKVGSMVDLRRAIQTRAIGSEVRLKIVRKGAEQTVALTLAENPND